MPKRNIYPTETLEMLESLWAQGMQNCSTDENKLKIQQASMATGLVDERIKQWIYWRNRKKKEQVDEGKSKRKKSCSKTTMATIVSADVTQKVSKEINQDVAEVVARGHQSTSSSYEGMNRTIPHLPVPDPNSSQKTVAQLIQSVEEKVQELQACNCDVIFLVYNQSSRCLSTTGTLKGLNFLSTQNPGIDSQFAASVSMS